jgi:DnaJ-class molecular chaperone
MPKQLRFVIRQTPHERFERDGDDLIVRRSVGLADALTRFACEVRGIDGTRIALEMRGVVRPGDEQRVKRQGMPKDFCGRGDLVVKFDVVFPTRVRPECESIIRRCLDESEEWPGPEAEDAEDVTTDGTEQPADVSPEVEEVRESVDAARIFRETEEVIGGFEDGTEEPRDVSPESEGVIGEPEETTESVTE